MGLFVKPGTKLGDIRQVLSFPIAAAQCRGYLRRKLPNATFVAANSTAEAAATVARSKRTDQAAIGNELAARLYGLKVLAHDIEDHPENQTRFVVVGRGIPAPTGHDKTTIVCFQRADRPGSLLAMLQEFAARRINLTKLESRPTKKSLGDYCFFIDIEGHIARRAGGRLSAHARGEGRAREVPRVLSRGRARRSGAPDRGHEGVARRRHLARRSPCAGSGRDSSMIDLKRLRDEPEYRAGIERKRVRAGLIDDVIAADAAHRALLTEVEELRARQNAASKEIGQAAADERPGEDRGRGRVEGRARGARTRVGRGRSGVARAGPGRAQPGRPERARRWRGRR